MALKKQGNWCTMPTETVVAAVDDDDWRKQWPVSLCLTDASGLQKGVENTQTMPVCVC